MYGRLSKETLYLRYMALYQPGIKDMQAVCEMPASEGAALVAQRSDTNGTIIDLAYYRFDRNHSDGSPEFAIVVEDGFQGRGVGKALLKHLCRQVAAMGVKTMNASIHPRNRRMRHLLYRTDYPFDEHAGPDTVEAAIHLQPGFAAGRRNWFGHGRHTDPFAGLDLEPAAW
jgi:acetyltransferase